MRADIRNPSVCATPTLPAASRRPDGFAMCVIAIAFAGFRDQFLHRAASLQRANSLPLECNDIGVSLGMLLPRMLFPLD
jgi:hypothetical protein